ncbi:subtilisin-like protein [Lactarius deliciosus]|nr:subtilisin-like protein [Lactarius deliciosus]
MRYHWLYALSSLTATPLADFAQPLAPWGDVRVKHAWSSVPANWETLGCPSAGTTIDLYISLNPRHDNALIDALLRDMAHISLKSRSLNLSGHTQTRSSLSHPGSHITASGPPRSQRHTAVVADGQQCARVAGQRNVGASYQLYRHAKANDTIIRTVSYTLPDVLRAHIQAVAPTTYFASARTLRQTSRRRSVEAAASLEEADAASGNPVTVLSSRDDEMVMPSELRWLYETFAYVPTAADRNTLGIFGFRKEYPSQTDLTVFMTHFRSDVPTPSLASFTVELVNGGEYDSGNPGDEANLDVQYTSAMAYPTPIIFYSIGGTGKWVTNTGEPYSGDEWLESLGYLLEKAVIPQTISISYSTHERNLGARGVSVLLSTGDDGVGENCMDDSGNVRFVTDFPASCPYLTAVGGTTDYDPEVAAPLSGGGFSDHFPRPAYQDVAVSAFLERQGTQYAGLYNREGRGIPDIAAQALMLPIVVRNDGMAMDGTSGSTPVCLSLLRPLCVVHSQPTINVQIVAGVISLLNDYLITNGRPPLGFLNIRLYDDGFTGLNDITSGSNPGCDTDGFSAVPGWDPVTGLGTPDFEKLQSIFMIPLGGGAGQGSRPMIHGPGE